MQLVSTNPRYRLAVIGAGWFASRRHIPDILAHPKAQLVALCRRDPQKLQVLADHFGVSKRYTDYQEMIEKETLDAVLICTPHRLHYEHARYCLERGLHVLLEKPMTVTTAEGRELLALARQKQQVLVVAYNPPYWRHCHELRRWVQGEEGKSIGELESVNLLWCGSAEVVFGRAPLPQNLPGVVPPELWRADPELGGGGHLMDGGCHVLSELLWVTGRRVVRCHAFFDALPTDMRVSASMELEGGIPVTFNSRADSQYPERRVRNSYLGSLGMVHGEGLPLRMRTEGVKGHPDTIYLEKDLPPVSTPVEDLITAIETHRPPLGSPEHALAVVELVEALYQSGREGRPISLPPD